MTTDTIIRDAQAAAGYDEQARVFLLGLSDLVAPGRTRVTRGRSPAECQEFLHADQCPASP